MKTKNLVIIFISLLFITLFSCLVIFLTGEKKQQSSNFISEVAYSESRPPVVEKPAQVESDKPVLEKIIETKPIAQPKKTVSPEVNASQAELIQAVMLINGVKYQADIKLGSSVYDFMSALKEQEKLDFQGKNYADLGFFVEEINGVKNNSAGKNWLYYVNGQPAQVGASNYKFKNNDIIEWKYENKFF